MQTSTIIFLYFQASQVILQNYIQNGMITKEDTSEEWLHAAQRKMILYGFPLKMRKDL